MNSLLLTLILFLPTVGFSTESQTYYYDPQIVELSGTIERQTFPGRPGYESIKNGDEVERGFYLRLTSPINVDFLKNNSDGNAEPEKNTGVIQLTWNAKNPERVLRKAAGKNVILKGHQIHGYNGHHHAQVLMWVDQARVVHQ